MKHVNNYKINIRENVNSKINIPITQSNDLSNQEDVVNKYFVEKEVELAINTILDYEKVRVKPINLSNDKLIESISYRINLMTNPGSFNTNTRWSDIGFNALDFNAKRSAFQKTFIRLDFFDSDDPQNQRLLFFITMFPKITIGEFTPEGNPPDPTNYPLTFSAYNNKINREYNSEGYNIYYFKDEVLPTITTDIYMRASLLNAKDGKVINLMSSNNPNLTISELSNGNSIHTKYKIKRINPLGYVYEIDNSYSQNVTLGNSTHIVNLYEINAN